MAVPKLRFAGFNDEWKTYTLSDILSLVGGNAFSSKDASKNGVNWLKIANVGFGNVTWDVQDYLPLDFKDKYPNYLLDCGDIILTLTRPILNGNLKIAEVTSRDLPALLNQRVAKLQINEDMVDKKYIFHLLRNRKTILKIESSISGTDPPNLGNNELRKILVTIPLINESKKIAKFMDIVDKKIQLQQEKIDLLKEQKKGFIQKIFSQELRFKDEDGQEFPKWGNKPLGELGQFGVSYSYSRSFEGEGFIHHVHYGDIHTKLPTICDKVQLPSITEQRDFEFVHEGDILFADASEDYNDLGKAVLVRTLHSVKTIAGLHTHKFTPNESIYPLYLIYVTQTNEYREYIRKMGTGVSVLGISKPNLAKFNILLPSMNEQIKIGKFLFSFEKKLYSLNGQLDYLFKQKQAFMQQMFI